MKNSIEPTVSLKRLRFTKETLRTLTVSSGVKTGHPPLLSCTAFTDCRTSGVSTVP